MNVELFLFGLALAIAGVLVVIWSQSKRARPAAAADGVFPSFQIAKLRLVAGDILIVKIEGHISQEIACRIRDNMKAEIQPDIKVLVLDGGITLSVLSRADFAGVDAAAA